MELKTIQEEAVRIEAEPEIVKTEIETMREFNRKVARAARIIYMKLLEGGSEGATLDQLTSEMEFEGASPQAVKAALGLMMKEGLATEVKLGRYAPTSAVKLTGGKVYEVLVEKIYPGSAVVRVNDKWRARLDPYDYDGPRNLIKKNARFTAAADLYRMNGTLCIRIKEVAQKL